MGVFAGCCNAEWASRTAKANATSNSSDSSEYDININSKNSHSNNCNDHALGPYTATGAASAVLANRISFALGMRGPSQTVDTACSSSLVALHNACRALQAGDCPAAVVGAVNVLIEPQAFEAFCSMKMLAPDGKCKAFDAAADGYVRGEGAGAVVLKRLSDARAVGDRVLAVIRGALYVYVQCLCVHM